MRRTLWSLMAILVMALAACTPGDAPADDVNDPATVPTATARAGDDDGRDDDDEAGDDPTGDGVTGDDPTGDGVTGDDPTGHETNG